jgi:hypothetical protein
VDNKTVRRFSFLFVFALPLLFSACKPTEPEAILMGGNYYEVDSQFYDLYNALGGLNVFGPAISPKFTHQDSEYQYTAAALFVFNPLSPAGNQISFAPIGLELGIAGQGSTGEDLSAGLIVYPGFQNYYGLLGGWSAVGDPITNVQYNSEKGRLEQHFENLGFYQLDSDPEGRVHLLHYGAWMCSARCDFSSHQNSVVSLYKSNVEPFIDIINSLDADFLGRPITKPYIAPDGKIQQIFQNVVLSSSPQNVAQYTLRPIPGMLGIPIEPEIIHTIPEHFRIYIQSNIGSEYAGPAITAYTQQSQDVYRQCFQNLCLNYFPNKPLDEQISLVPLGYLYRQKFYNEAETYMPEVQPVVQAYSINVWETEPITQPNSDQTIGVIIREGEVPVSNVEVYLLLKLAENITIRYTFPITQSDGSASLSLNPIDAPHGTVIHYDVCVSTVNQESTCVSESFLIWGNP